MTPEERVREIINTHCLSQAKIARSMGVNDKKLSSIANGKRRLSAAELYEFCKAAHISADDFFEGMRKEA